MKIRYSGESTRLPLNVARVQIWRRRHMCEFVVGSLLCSERFFSGYFDFPLFSKAKTVPNSNATRNQEDEEPLIRCGITKSLLIYFYFIPIYISSNFSLFGLPVWLIKSCARERFLTKSLWQYFRMSLFAFSFTGYFFNLERYIQSALSYNGHLAKKDT